MIYATFSRASPMTLSPTPPTWTQTTQPVCCVAEGGGGRNRAPPTSLVQVDLLGGETSVNG